jgi:Fur family ferric uptake transcriptional regulator
LKNFSIRSGAALELEGIIGKIRGRGFKATPQRVAVLKAIRAEQHQSLERIRSRCPGVGLVTVYRTLDLLSELGLVRRLDLGDGPRYELAEDPPPSPHLRGLRQRG